LEHSISITDQINQKYREYALYVLQSRGIPNFYDSLTPVQRIVLQNSPSQFNKTIGLVGEVIRTGLYHHGDSSLAGAISKLARPFGCSYQLLEGDGFFGSPVNPTPSAARYTSVKINPSIKNIVQQHSDLNDKNEEGGTDYLNLEIPIGLLTHIVGIAVGYRSNILPRKMEDIVEYLDGKNKVLKPYFRDFSGKIFKFEGSENTWLIESGYEVNPTKRSIRIFDLPPVMRYDSFMDKLYPKLDLLGYDYRINNESQSKCDLTIVFSKVTPKELEVVSNVIKKMTQIVVKEDVVFVRDGAVAEFESVKEYLDAFKIHLENVKLKRMLKDEENFKDDLAFLEAKLKFLIFMSQKKRANKEIEEFLSQFQSKISHRLSLIQIVKLSEDHIEETRKEIERIKAKIKETQALIKAQKKVVLELAKRKPVPKSSKLMVSSTQEVPSEINGIEVFNLIEDEESEEQMEESNV
jgi:DNA gyrase/topoisomerase IV subunit A